MDRLLGAALLPELGELDVVHVVLPRHLYAAAVELQQQRGGRTGTTEAARLTAQQPAAQNLKFAQAGARHGARASRGAGQTACLSRGPLNFWAECQHGATGARHVPIEGDADGRRVGVDGLVDGQSDTETRPNRQNPLAQIQARVERHHRRRPSFHL